MAKATFAVDLMEYSVLLRHLRTELLQLERYYPPAFPGSPLQRHYERLNLLARELELRGLQGRLEI